MKKILPPTLLWICFFGMVLLRWIVPLVVFYELPWNLIGIIPVGLGITLMLTAWVNFVRLGTNIKPYGQPDQFVFGGPYRFSRNLMVLGFGLILVGVWVLLGALSPLLGVAAFMMIIDRWVIPFEERQMKNKFGQAYTAYCLKTGRWISL